MKFFILVKKAHSSFLNLFFKNKFISWYYWKTYQYFLILLFGRKPNVLMPEDLNSKFNNCNLRNDLKSVININSINHFTLDAETINFVWEKLHKIRPKHIIEFGCGQSTKLIAEYFRIYPEHHGTLISIDQDQSYIQKCQEEISIPVNLRHCYFNFPVNSEGYIIDHYKLKREISKFGYLDFIIVDGPHGGWMVRRNTLISILHYCKNGSYWFLDDSFRDSEMEILRIWKKTNQIKLKGIYNIGKGLSCGIVESNKNFDYS